MLTSLLAVCLAVFFQQIEADTSSSKPSPHPLLWAWPLTLEGYTESVYQVVHSPKGRIIATVGSDRVARLWKATTGRELRRLEGQIGHVLGIKFSPDSKFIAMACADQTIHLWETATGKKILYLPSSTLAVSRVVHATNGKRIAVSSYQGRTHLWDTVTMVDLGRFTYPISTFNDSLFKPDDLRFLSEEGGVFQIWNARIGKLLFEMEVPEDVEDPGFFVRFGHGDDYKKAFLAGVDPSSKRMALSEDARCVATADHRGTVRVWNGVQGWRFGSPTGQIQHIGFLDDGQFFLVKVNQDKTITIWYLSCD